MHQDKEAEKLQLETLVKHECVEEEKLDAKDNTSEVSVRSIPKLKLQLSRVLILEHGDLTNLDQGENQGCLHELEYEEHHRYLKGLVR